MDVFVCPICAVALNGADNRLINEHVDLCLNEASGLTQTATENNTQMTHTSSSYVPDTQISEDVPSSNEPTEDGAECPLCNERFSHAAMSNHLDECLNYTSGYLQDSGDERSQHLSPMNPFDDPAQDFDHFYSSDDHHEELYDGEEDSMQRIADALVSLSSRPAIERKQGMDIGDEDFDHILGDFYNERRIIHLGGDPSHHTSHHLSRRANSTKLRETFGPKLPRRTVESTL